MVAQHLEISDFHLSQVASAVNVRAALLKVSWCIDCPISLNFKLS